VRETHQLEVQKGGQVRALKHSKRANKRYLHPVERKRRDNSKSGHQNKASKRYSRPVEYIGRTAGTSHDTKPQRARKAHSLTRWCRDELGHKKNVNERGVLTNWRAQKAKSKGRGQRIKWRALTDWGAVRDKSELRKKARLFTHQLESVEGNKSGHQRRPRG
jgi:hypothetical protein